MASPVLSISEPIDVTIAISTALSPSVNLMGRIPTAILMPAAWTAAGISFQASPDGTTWYDVHSTTAEITVTAAVDIYIDLDSTVFFGARYLKIRSGTSATPVNQAAARTLVLMAGRLDVV